jgi:DNA polymerase-3 subunit alpha
MTQSFVHLHVHTEYSMLDGAAKIHSLFAEAGRLGMPAVAMTDHGNMCAAAEFFSVAQETAVKPIIGIEAYLAPLSRSYKQPVFWGDRGRVATPSSAAEGRGGDAAEGGQESVDVGGRGAYTHMTMLAENATGLRNLFRLSSLASFEGTYRRPRMDKELLAQHAGGIIATTGCLGGEVSTRLKLGQFDKALEAAGEFRDIFGPDNFFLEVMDHGIPLERTIRRQLLEIGTKLDLTPVATNDSHYVTADQADAHAALLCVQSGKTLDDPRRFQFAGEGYHLKSPAEMREYWDRELPGAADATLLIAERVQSYAEAFSYVDRMPRVPLPEGKTEDGLLRAEVEHYLYDRFPLGLPRQYRERAEWELSVIAQMGFCAYFLVIGDIVRWAKTQGVLVGPGRGSATGSLVAYLLHITDLDPIEHNLIFERFLNPERVSPPDIDLDFDDRGRGKVLRYAIEKWGQHSVAQVVTFGKIKTKAAIKDSARALYGQAGFRIADSISKALPPAVAQVDIPLSGIFDPTHPRFAEAAEVRSMVDADPQVASILSTARGLEGLVRNTGVHACAVILSSEPLLDVIPLWRREDGAIITSWDYPACENIGLLKMDFLAVSTQSVVLDAIAAVRANYGVTIELADLPLDDPKTYQLLARGDTLGVFQLDGAAMRDLLRRMRPTQFGDLAAVLALYRPGPMEANAHNNYADRKNGRQDITPIHPELETALEPILGETYHLLVYQEQVMAIAQQLAGYTLGAADLLRRAMGKKKKAILEKEYSNFAAGMAGKGFSPEATETLWNVMLPFAGYAFNRSHTAGYGTVAYWTAYLKANYPAEFMASQLTNLSDKKDKSAVYLAECRRMGIQVLSPDVNESEATFTAAGGAIRFGLSAVRNVGAAVVASIIDTRRHKGPYRSFTDFMEKVELPVCNKRVIDSLIRGGAFDSLGHTRLSLVQAHEDAVDAVVSFKRREAEGQFDLFAADPGDSTCAVGGSGAQDTSVLAHLRLDDLEWPRKQLLAAEREMLGLYVSAHPLDGAEPTLRRHAPKPIAVLVDDAPRDREQVVVAGMIASVERRISKKGDPWAIVVIEDLDSTIEVLFFARSYAMWRAELVADAAVAVRGRVNWREDKISVFANDLIVLNLPDTVAGPVENTSAAPAPQAPLVLHADAKHVTADTVAALREILTAHRGPTPVQLVVRGTTDVWLDVTDYPVATSQELAQAVRRLPGMRVLPR